MISTQRRLQNLSVHKIINLAVFVAVATIVLMWWKPLELTDLSFYTESGRAVLDGRNPYNSPDLYQSKWGAVGAILIYLGFGWYPVEIASLLLLILNFLGILMFTRVVAGKDFSQLKVYVSLILVSAVNRENLVNGQITGLILLAIAASVEFSKIRRISLFAIPFLGFAIEMKPQVAIPLILFLFTRKTFPFKSVVVYFFLSRVALFFISGEIVEIQLLGILLTKSTKNSEGVWNDTHNVLPVLDYFLNNSSLVRAIGLILTLALILVIMIKKSVLSLILLPAVLPYIHLYDLIGILVISLTHKTKGPNMNLSWIIILGILISPLKFFSIPTLILIALFSLAIVSNSSSYLPRRITRFEPLYIIFILTTVIGVGLVSEDSLIPCVTLLLSVIALLYSRVFQERIHN